ncbi:hypothetical protein BDA96_03G071700 [Sorghum bicolor]|uniref:Uncharacterized protein n=1 Tax=Sorghum bicolor TaxID=4558 RepID=A0A921R9Q7_SORBI|nr:hypothetical protein BDA96_03G071700 [Sorghum bicolor]
MHKTVHWSMSSYRKSVCPTRASHVSRDALVQRATRFGDGVALVSPAGRRRTRACWPSRTSCASSAPTAEIFAGHCTASMEAERRLLARAAATGDEAASLHAGDSAAVGVVAVVHAGSCCGIVRRRTMLVQEESLTTAPKSAPGTPPGRSGRRTPPVQGAAGEEWKENSAGAGVWLLLLHRGRG